MKQQIKQILLVALVASFGVRADESNSDFDALRATTATIEDEGEFILSIEPDGADLSIVTDKASPISIRRGYGIRTRKTTAYSPT